MLTTLHPFVGATHSLARAVKVLGESKQGDASSKKRARLDKEGGPRVNDARLRAIVLNNEAMVCLLRATTGMKRCSLRTSIAVGILVPRG